MSTDTHALFHLSRYRTAHTHVKKLDQQGSYNAASASTKQYRSELDVALTVLIKVIHAETELDAEDLLNQVRDPSPQLGDD